MNQLREQLSLIYGERPCIDDFPRSGSMAGVREVEVQTESELHSGVLFGAMWDRDLRRLTFCGVVWQFGVGDILS